MNLEDLHEQSERDQSQAQNDTWAWFLADRLRAYREAGIPENLALLLVRDINFVGIVKAFYPNIPPSMNTAYREL